MSEQLDWDAYRYVLDDPTLDRVAFENRMLDDVELALAVAEAVAHVDTLRAASFIASPSKNLESGDALQRADARPPLGWHWSTLAALAAGLIITIGLVNYRVIVQPDGLQARSESGEQRLAESWLAIRQVELVDASSNLVDASSSFSAGQSAGDETASEVTGIAANEATTDDWLIDAARDFYAQSPGDAG